MALLQSATHLSYEHFENKHAESPPVDCSSVRGLCKNLNRNGNCKNNITSSALDIISIWT